jgi:hypothetical protein
MHRHGRSLYVLIAGGKPFRASAPRIPGRPDINPGGSGRLVPALDRAPLSR